MHGIRQLVVLASGVSNTLHGCLHRPLARPSGAPIVICAFGRQMPHGSLSTAVVVLRERFALERSCPAMCTNFSMELVREVIQSNLSTELRLFSPSLAGQMFHTVNSISPARGAFHGFRNLYSLKHWPRGSGGGRDAGISFFAAFRSTNNSAKGTCPRHISTENTGYAPARTPFTAPSGLKLVMIPYLQHCMAPHSM